MLTLKTRREYNIQINRRNYTAHVFLTINELIVDDNGFQPSGFYYIEQDGDRIFLDDVAKTMIPWSFVEQLESSQKVAFTKIQDALIEKLEFFVRKQLELEGTDNYGIFPEDWAKVD